MQFKPGASRAKRNHAPQQSKSRVRVKHNLVGPYGVWEFEGTANEIEVARVPLQGAMRIGMGAAQNTWIHIAWRQVEPRRNRTFVDLLDDDRTARCRHDSGPKSHNHGSVMVSRKLRDYRFEPGARRVFDRNPECFLVGLIQNVWGGA